MITFIASIALLIIGYFTYGKLVEKVFGINESRQTPAYAKQDGVDYIPMGWKRNSLIQLLNIAGLGPIFGPIMGALWGPAAFLWIVFGSILAGAVHDYLTGMISIRNNGAHLPALVRKYLGKGMHQFVNAFTLVLLVLVGTVFVTGPAKLLESLTPSWITLPIIVAAIFIYYVLATLLPVDKIIGKIYPIFGALLLIMAFGIGASLIFGGYNIPELTLANLHPKELPLFPLLFITISCGAISGFHATQSPIISRTTQNERYGRKIFYGMMIAEGIIAMIWAAAAMTVFDGTGGLQAILNEGGPAAVVSKVAMMMMGGIGGTLAILGVIILPITSGDTAFRGARMLLADYFNMSQVKLSSRLVLSVPMFVIAFALTKMDFTIIWRYFSWANQTTAMIALWVGAVYLLKNNKFHWIASVPASFMTVVSFTYILQAPEGFKLDPSISLPLGIACALVVISLFVRTALKQRNQRPMDMETAA